MYRELHSRCGRRWLLRLEIRNGNNCIMNLLASFVAVCNFSLGYYGVSFSEDILQGNAVRTYLQTELELASESIRLNPEDVSELGERASLYLTLEEYDSCIADCNKVLSIDRDNLRALIVRGLAFCETGLVHSALQDGLAAQRRYPKDADVLLLLGDASYLKGMLAESITYFKRAIELDPEESKAYRQLAQIKRGCGDLNEALEYIDDAIEIFPADMVSHLIRFDILCDLYRYNDAEDELRKLKERGINVDSQKKRLIAPISTIID